VSTRSLALAIWVGWTGCTVSSPGPDAAVEPDAGCGDVDTRLDQDGDGLADGFEGTADSDGDGLSDDRDPDADGDGIGDAEESGRRGPCRALDTDGDGRPDHLDADSDDDGLSDAEERRTHGTSPYDADSDDDGYTDLAEVLLEDADPLDPGRGVPEDDFYVVLPYLSPSALRELAFTTRVRRADVFFLMDRTGSMTAEVEQLRVGLREVVRRMVEQIPDLGVGVGGFAGFGGPYAPFCDGSGACGSGEGEATDVPFNLYGVITTDVDAMQSMVDALRADLGGAIWASFNEALFQSATGRGVLPWVAPQSCPEVPDELGRRFGYPCFRPGALPILVVMSDSSSRNGPLTTAASGGVYDTSAWPMGRAATYGQTVEALVEIGARVIGIATVEPAEGLTCLPAIPEPTGAAQFAEYARATGTLDRAGEPIVFGTPCNGEGLGDALVDAVRTLADQTPHDVSTLARDGEEFPEGTPPLDATRFLRAVRPLRLDEAGRITPCPDPDRCDATTFRGVPPDARVVFQVEFVNDFVPPGPTARLYRATLLVVGDGRAELDARDVLVIVPASSTPLLE
jgi:hypothetical protein